MSIPHNLPLHLKSVPGMCYKSPHDLWPRGTPLKSAILEVIGNKYGGGDMHINELIKGTSEEISAPVFALGFTAQLIMYLGKYYILL